MTNPSCHPSSRAFLDVSSSPTFPCRPPSPIHRARRVSVCLSACFGLAMLASPALAQPYYAMKDIGLLHGGPWINPTCINPRGEIAGWAPDGTSGNMHAFLYSHGRIKDLGTLGGPNSYASGINAAGDVVGNSTLASAPRLNRAFLSTRGRMQNLGTLGGSESTATGINAHGEVTGYSLIKNDAAWHAFLWSRGRMKDLGALGGRDTRATAINDSGEVVGYFDSPDHHAHAFLYTGGIMTDLGTILSGLSSYATAINAWGEVTGGSNIGASADRAFLYSHGTMTDLGALGTGGYLSGGQSINRWTQIVGTSEYPVNSGQYRAIIFSGVMHDLNELVLESDSWVLTAAQGINDAGQIVALGHRGLEGPHGFLLTPLPEGRADCGPGR